MELKNRHRVLEKADCDEKDPKMSFRQKQESVAARIEPLTVDSANGNVVAMVRSVH